MLLVLLPFYISAVWAKVEWVDPHSMDHDGVKLAPPQCANEDMIIKPYYERMLNLLITSFKYDEDGMNYKSRLELSVEDLELLKRASKSLSSGDYVELNKLDTVLSNAWKKTVWVEYGDIMMSWSELLKLNLFSQEAAIVLGGMVALFFVYSLMNARISIKKVFKYLIFFAYVIDFVFTWISLVKKAEIEQMADSMKFKTIPDECDPDKVGWFKWMVMNNDKCREYHRVHLLGVIWTVSPMKVFGTQIGELVYTPAHALGAAIGEFTTAIIGCFSWYFLPFVPFLLFFILCIIGILLSFITNTSLSFNLFYVIQMKFGEGRKNNQLEDSLSGKNLKKVLGVFKQPALENKKEKSKKSKLKIENVGSDDKKKKSVTGRPVETTETVEEVTKKEELVAIENIASSAAVAKEECDESVLSESQ